MTAPTSRERQLEAELAAMVRYAHRLEANDTAHKVREGVPGDVIVAAITTTRTDFGVAEVMHRYISGRNGDRG